MTSPRSCPSIMGTFSTKDLSLWLIPVGKLEAAIILPSHEGDLSRNASSADASMQVKVLQPELSTTLSSFPPTLEVVGVSHCPDVLPCSFTSVVSTLLDTSFPKLS